MEKFVNCYDIMFLTLETFTSCVSYFELTFIIFIKMNLTKLVEMSNRSLFSSIFYLFVISDPNQIVSGEVIAEPTCISYAILFFTI